MDLASAIEVKDTYADDIPELVWSTGPVSYEYHFSTRALFDPVVSSSWHRDGTLFAAEATTLALDDGALMGIEIGMAGNEYRERQAALAPIWQDLVENHTCEWADVKGVIERSDKASWLNPVIHSDTYYIHALAVKPEARGRRLGYALIADAIRRAKEAGFKKLQLDVLSDNPAVSFYHAVGLELLAETRAPDPEKFGVPPEYRMGMTL